MGSIEVREGTVDDVDALVTIQRGVEAERVPHHPPIGPDEALAWSFDAPDRKPQRIWVAWLDGRPAGYGIRRLARWENTNRAEVVVEVSPPHRRSGVGTRLVQTVLATVPAERTVVQGVTEAGVGAAWCERLGLSVKQVVTESRQVVAECDLTEIESWVRPAAALAASYDVVSWHGPYPDELLPAICDAENSMQDQPFDDLDHQAGVVTPELCRDGEQAESRRTYGFGCLALTADGRAAGFTELSVNIHRPAIGYQGDTVVVAEHRGHRLGRWLKAANLLNALAVRPELSYVTTHNAESNPHMLAINDALGYRPVRDLLVHQGPLPDVRARLDGRGTDRDGS